MLYRKPEIIVLGPPNVLIQGTKIGGYELPSNYLPNKVPDCELDD
jgi:hypothetical protein